MLKFLQYVFTFILVSSLGIWFLLHSDYMQKPLITRAEIAITQALNAPAKIQNFTFSLPATIIANEISLGETDTPWLVVDKMSFHFSISKLWSGGYFPFLIEISHAQLNSIPDLSSFNTRSESSPLNLSNPIEQIAFHDLQISPKLLNALSLPLSTLSLDGTLTSDGTLQFFLLNTPVDPITISGKFHYSPSGQLNDSIINLKVNLDHFFNVEPFKSGIVCAECILSGDVASPKAAINFTSQNIFNASGKANIVHTENSWIGQIDLNATWQEMPTRFRSDFQWKVNAPILLTNLHFNAPQMHIEGKVDLWPSENWLEGQLALSHHDLSQLNPLLPITAQGFALGIIRFDRSPQPTTHIDLNASKMMINEVQLEGLHFIADLADLLNHPKIQAQLSSEKLAFDNCILENALATTTIDLNESNWPYSLDFNGKWRNLFAISTTGEWHSQGDSILLAINTCQGNIDSTPFSLQEATLFEISNNVFKLSPLSFQLGNSTLLASVDYSKEKIDGSLKITELPIAFLKMDAPLSGLISADAKIIGTLNAPTSTISLKAENLTYNDSSFAPVPPASAQLKLDIEREKTSCSGNFLVPNTLPIDLTATIPLTLSLNPFSLNFDQNAALEGHLAGSTEITSLLHFFPDPPALSGIIQAKFDLTGTFNSPKINGSCDIADGTFDILKLGTMLHSLKANIEISESELTIESLSANSEKGGTVRGKGSMLLDFSQKCPFNVTLNLEHAVLLNQDYTKASFDGELSLDGDLDKGKLSGSLNAYEAQFTLPDQPKALMNHVEVKYINQPDDEPIPQAQKLAQTPTIWPLTLDIEIHFPENLAITGKDLNSTWKGDLKVQGLNKEPQLIGDIKVTEGHYLFNGKPFDINQGTVTFAGEIDKKTSVYIIAHKDLDEVEVDVILKGPVKNPSVSFRSNPPLPQREILSWILFNRGTSEISPFQGSQLNESITNLDSKSQGPDVLTKIRTSLGIDRLDITPSGTGDDNQMNLQIGKYISDNVLVSINKSDVNSLAIEAALTNRIKLQAEVGDDAQGQMILKWKRDY